MKKLFRHVLLIALSAFFTAFTAFAAQSIFYGMDDNGGEYTANFAFTKKDGILSGTSEDNDPHLTIPVDFSTDDYPVIQIRMRHELEERSDQKTFILQIYYTGTDFDGNELSLSEANSLRKAIPQSSDGEFVTYTLAFPDSVSGARINQLRADIVNSAGTFDIDYIMLTNPGSYTDKIFHFDDGLEGWIPENVTSYSVENGNITGVNRASNGLIKNTSLNLPCDVYGDIYVRMKADGLTEDRLSIIYTNLLDADGSTVKNLYGSYNGYTYLSAPVKASDNGKYVLYRFSPSEKYSEQISGNHITQMTLNCVNQADAEFFVDCIIIKNGTQNYVWDFGCDGFADGWSLSDSNFSVSGGLLRYTAPDAYKDPQINLYSLSLDADKFSGVEIIMKNESTKSDTLQIYYSGTDSLGETFSVNEYATVKKSVPSTSHDSFEYYYLDLSDAFKWQGSTITNIRIDPINSLGSFEIDRIAFIPASKTPQSGNLSPDECSLSYEFDSLSDKYANGKISIDFGPQNSEYAKNVRLCWAVRGDDGLYSDIPEYTAIKSLKGTEAEAGYTISKNILVPEGANALCAYVTDSENVFELYFNLPEQKQSVYQKPLYTVAFASDFHFGGWGSETSFVTQQINAFNQINGMADLLVANGDLTQWYGETAKRAEWDLAKRYFKQFDIPVFAVQGNHDVPETHDDLHSAQYFKDFLSDWIDYSEQNGKYTANYDPDVNYYDAEINGNHYIFLTIPNDFSYSFGTAQLEWLDKKLFENEESGKPIFVFGHVASNRTVGFLDHWSANQIQDDSALKQILAKHPTAIYISAHSHFTLESDLATVIDGKQTSPSYIHDGGIITNNILDSSASDGLREVLGSSAVLADVYEDRIVVRGRDFLNEKWIPQGLYQITFAPKAEIHDLTAYKSQSSGGITLIADCSAADDDITYTWFVDGKEQASGKMLTLTGETESQIALRATDAAGSYISTVFDGTKSIIYAAENTGKISARITAPNGLRFIGEVPDTFYSSSNIQALEFGFVVGLAENFKDSLPQPGNKGTVTGIAYSKKDGTNIKYAVADEKTQYSGVLVKIPKDKYDTEFTVVTYMKYSVGTEEYTAYGKPVTQTVTQFLESLKGTPDYGKAAKAFGIE